MIVVTSLYQACASVGHTLGCHQRPDRSFFFHGKQFPVCARCTGVFLGECICCSLSCVFSLFFIMREAGEIPRLRAVQCAAAPRPAPFRCPLCRCRGIRCGCSGGSCGSSSPSTTTVLTTYP
ncbi:MAG: DUF2085 domain-containing protein [Dysosmobacter sp.]